MIIWPIVCWRGAMADVNQAAYLAKGGAYRASHPVDCSGCG